MKFYYSCGRAFDAGVPKKILRIMKLTFLFLTCCFLHVSAISFAQKITLSEEKAPLEKIIREISKQSGYDFLGDVKLIKKAKPVTINVSEVSIEEAMNTCLRNQEITYSIENKIVLIKPKERAATQQPDNTNADVLRKNVLITGTVVDTLGLPLPGVTVSLKGNPSIGTPTDVNGYFSLTVPENATIVVNLIGYVRQEIPIGTQKIFHINLREIASNLSEVVVVAYGTQKKVSVTAAISSVSSKELKQSAVANISQALAGRLPGLITVQNSGEPGADAAAIYIRGTGTFNTGAAGPLVLVDGIERPFDGIDANEIESISILKDASSTAVYGVRGANGVVLVTTKRGVIGAPQISFTTQAGLQSPTRLPKYTDAYDGLHLFREGLINDGSGEVSTYTDAYIDKFRDRSHPAYQYLYPDVDWLKVLLKPTSLLQQNNLNVTGGTERAKYFISLSYLKQDGLYNFADQIKDYNIQAVLNKYNFRSNIDLQITKDLSMELSLATVISDQNYPGTSAADLFNAAKSRPAWFVPVTNPDGSIAEKPFSPGNPYGALTQTGYQRNFDNQATSTTGFTLKLPWITDGLSIKARLSFDVNNYRNLTRGKTYNSYHYTLVNDQDPNLSDGIYTNVATGANNLSYNINANGTRKTVLETYLNYDKSFHKHTINAFILYTQQESFQDVGSGDATVAVQGLPYKYQGVVGRAAYNYDEKYLAEFDAGYNGSENFPAGKRYGFFPAFSAGYVLSNESFIKNNPGLSFINLLKIRGSIGVVGNDRFGAYGSNRFLYLSTYNLNGPGYTFGPNYDGSSYSGAIVSATGNQDVTWERARKIDLGLDLNLWNDWLDLTADVFSEHRTNILTAPNTLPDFVGIAAPPLINAGVVNNKGYEITLNTRHNFNSKEGFYVRINYSFARNKIINIDEPSFAGREWQAQTGTKVGELKGLTAIGLFKNQADIDSSPEQTFGTVIPGDIKYKDLNHDGKITSLDEGYLGKVNTPESILGAAFGYHIGNLDLSVLFQGGFGGSVYLTGNSVWPFVKFTGALQEVYDNHWTPTNLNAEFPRISSNVNSNNDQNSTFWIRSNNYLRLKNAEIGYTFSKNLIKKVGLKTARAFVNGVNLLTWDKVKLFDPEIPNGTGDYPQQKIFNAGVNITF